MEKIKEMWKGFTGKVSALWKKVCERTVAIWKRFTAWLSDFWKKLTEKLGAWWSSFTKKVIDIWNVVKDKFMALWGAFADKNPKVAQWVREGGLFFIVSNVITAFKWVILSFLPLALAFMGSQDFGFPGLDVTLFGIDFKWYIIGYGADQGGLAYFTAYMIAMVIGEVINFFIQRKWVFRSNGNILRQGLWYLLAFCVVTCVVNSINCVWVAVAGNFVKPWLYNIGTTVLNGGVSMVVFFIVNKIVFNDGSVNAPRVESTNTDSEA